MRILHVGYGAYVFIDRVVWIAPLQGVALKRLREARKADRRVVDLTYGHSAATLLGCDDNTLIISSVRAETLQRRINKNNPTEEEN